MSNTAKELGFMLAVGALIGVLFNVAMTGSPFDVGGIIGGLITGLLMYLFS